MAGSVAVGALEAPAGLGARRPKQTRGVRRGPFHLAKQNSLKEIRILQPVETCGFLNTRIKGNRHLEGNV